jgi:general nucleoside transport system permease protein
VSGAVARPYQVGGVSIARHRVSGLVYILVGVLILFLWGGVEPGSESRFELNTSGVAIMLPPLVLPSAPVIWGLAGVCVFLGAIQLARGLGARKAYALATVVLIVVITFLVWAASGRSMNLLGVMQASLFRAVPLTFAALSGVLCERAGVVNIAIEGMLLTGAFVSSVVGSAFGPGAGILAAALAGGGLAWVLAVLAIRYKVDQIIAGTIINIFAAGMTAFLSARVLTKLPDLNSPERVSPIPIPILHDIPVIGPLLFANNIFVYFLFFLICALHVGLFKTRWGLRVRAVGEHPKAADTMGIDVLRTRYINVVLGGMVAGIGGAFLVIGATGRFDKDMTAGRGFIGLAAMIFGAWTPIGSFFAALVFGFADALQARLSVLNVPIPSEVLLMVPYIVTIFVVAGLVGRSRAPAADGRPYEKE